MIEKTPNGAWRVRIFQHSIQVSTTTLLPKRAAEEWENSRRSALRMGTWIDPKLGATPLGK